MPPRYAYWTIIAGGLPTAFRAADRDELLPTFTRLREKHPDAEMKWFARGKLWDSPDAARHDSDRRRDSDDRHGQERKGRGGPGARERHGEDAKRSARGRDWRPGGEHRDPRQPYIDAKKVRNQDRRKEKFARKHAAGSDSSTGAPPFKSGWDKPRDNRFRDRPRDESRRPERERREPHADAARRTWDETRENRPRAPKSHDDRPRQREFRDGDRPRQREFRDGDRPRQREMHGRHESPRDRESHGGENRERFRNDTRAPKPKWDKPRAGAKPKGAWHADRDRGRKPAGSSARGDRQPHEGPGSRVGSSRDRFRDGAGPRNERWAKPRQEQWERPRNGSDRQDRPPRERIGSPKPEWKSKPKPEWNRSRDERFRDRPREESRQRERAPRSAERPGGPQWNRPQNQRLRDRDERPRDRDRRSPEGGSRPFERRGFTRNQGTEEPTPPPRPRDPNREPRPNETPEPTPPPRPNEPITTPPGPPERGRLVKRPRRS